MSYFVPDISEHNAPMSMLFSRDAVIIRATFSTYWLDKHFLANTATAKALWDAGRLRGGAVLYVPPIFPDGNAQKHYDFLMRAVGPTTPEWLTGFMIDAETWRGESYQQLGDHSQQLNTLYGLLAHRIGSFKGVKGYANVGDFRELWPHRDARCDAIVAAYGPSNPMRLVPGAVGWQYTNGQQGWTGGPWSTVPFGRCDHNVFPSINNGDQFRQLWGRPTYTQLHPPKTVKPPAKPPAKPSAPPVKLYGPGGDHIVSPNREYALYIHDDGTVAVHHNAVALKPVIRKGN